MDTLAFDYAIPAIRACSGLPPRQTMLMPSVQKETAERFVAFQPFPYCSFPMTRSIGSLSALMPAYGLLTLLHYHAVYGHLCLGTPLLVPKGVVAYAAVVESRSSAVVDDYVELSAFSSRE